VDLNNIEKGKFPSKKLEHLLNILNEFELKNAILENFLNKKSREKQKSGSLEQFLK
jgi:hypothetical protein